MKILKKKKKDHNTFVTICEKVVRSLTCSFQTPFLHFPPLPGFVIKQQKMWGLGAKVSLLIMYRNKSLTKVQKTTHHTMFLMENSVFSKATEYIQSA